MNTMITSANRTMSSREIAQLVESRHSDVCTTIDRLVKRGAISGMRQCRTPTPRTVDSTASTR